MPLVPATLETELRSALSTPFPKSGALAADKLASAYDTYARGAVAGTYPFSPTGAEKGRFSGALAPVLSLVPNAGPAVAAGFVAAITAYWTGATFTGGIPAPPTGAPALLPTLATLFSIPSNPKEIVVTGLAAALDACTRTVIVTVPAPPGATFPAT